MHLIEIESEDMEWILLPQGADQWRVLVNAVLSFLYTKG
jgi:hypothetical protein